MQIVAIAEAPTTRQARETSLHTGGTIRQALPSDNTVDSLNFRFTETSSVNHAPGHDIHQGDIAYSSRGGCYGPQREDHGVGLLLQFSFHGERQASPEWAKPRAAALERFNANGCLDGGIYYERDKVTGQEMARDANQALYEEQ